MEKNIEGGKIDVCNLQRSNRVGSGRKASIANEIQSHLLSYVNQLRNDDAVVSIRLVAMEAKRVDPVCNADVSNSALYQRVRRILHKTGLFYDSQHIRLKTLVIW